MKPLKNFIGLHIRQDRIEVILSTKQEEGIAVVRSHPLPDGFFTEEGEVASAEILTATLKETWKALNLPKKRVLLILNSRQAIVRLVTLPHIPPKQLHHAILSEAEQFALFRRETPLVDYFVINQTSEQTTVCYGAAPERQIQMFEAAFKANGLRLAGVDLVQVAGQRAMGHLNPTDERKWIGLLVLPQRLVVTSLENGKLATFRELLLPERANISMELVVLNYVPEVLYSVVGDEPAEQPKLVIGTERIDDARELLELAEEYNEYPYEVAIVNGDAENSPPCIAVGAVLWGQSEIYPSLNLIKGSATDLTTILTSVSEDLKDLGRDIVIPAITTLVTLVVFAGGLSFWRYSLMSQVTASKNRVAAITAEKNGILQQLSTATPEADILKQWVPRHDETVFAADLVSQMRTLIPSDTWISQMTYKAGKGLRVQGAALSQTSCLYFSDQLAGMDSVRQIHMLGLEKRDNMYAFDIQAGMEVPPAATP